MGTRRFKKNGHATDMSIYLGRAYKHTASHAPIALASLQNRCIHTVTRTVIENINELISLRKDTIILRGQGCAATTGDFISGTALQTHKTFGTLIVAVAISGALAQRDRFGAGTGGWIISRDHRTIASVVVPDISELRLCTTASRRGRRRARGSLGGRVGDWIALKGVGIDDDAGLIDGTRICAVAISISVTTFGKTGTLIHAMIGGSARNASMRRIVLNAMRLRALGITRRCSRLTNSGNTDLYSVAGDQVVAVLICSACHWSHGWCSRRISSRRGRGSFWTMTVVFPTNARSVAPWNPCRI